VGADCSFRATPRWLLRCLWGALTRSRLGARTWAVQSCARPADSEELSCSCRSGIWRSGACSSSSCFVLVQPSSRSWRSSCYGISWPYFVGGQPDEIAAIENDARDAREVLAVLNSYGSIHAYFASFPDAHAASADMRRRLKFLGETGLWRLLNSAVRYMDG
jgi:hypothetical protein